MNRTYSIHLDSNTDRNDTEKDFSTRLMHRIKSAYRIVTLVLVYIYTFVTYSKVILVRLRKFNDSEHIEKRPKSPTIVFLECLSAIWILLWKWIIYKTTHIWYYDHYHVLYFFRSLSLSLTFNPYISRFCVNDQSLIQI